MPTFNIATLIIANRETEQCKKLIDVALIMRKISIFAIKNRI